jgi:uncharacterized short protein YbdD (DUF466 family)
VTKLMDWARESGYWLARTARLMVGVPEYETYVQRRRMCHPGEPVMTYEEFFRERQTVRYSTTKGRFKGCC